MNKGKDKSEQILEAYGALIRASSCIQSMLSRQRSLDNVTFTQFGVLELLYKKGSMTQKDIASALSSSGSNIVTVVDNLEKSNYVIRVRDGKDRRNVFVELTPEGEEKIKKIYPKHVEAVSEKLRILNLSEIEQLITICGKLSSE